jgi:hypothetical protein
VRVVICLAPFLLAGCSQLLGIQDPSPRDGGLGNDADIVDGGPDPDSLAFRFGDFEVAQGQTVRVHVTATYPGGDTQDVTATATYNTDNAMVASFAGPGLVTSGTRAGTATITASLGSASTSLKVTVTAVACHPVINELQTAGASAADEWVEIYNPCTNAIDVTGWSLVYRGPSTVGTDDDTLLFTFAGPLAPGGIRLLAGAGYPEPNPNDGEWPNPTGEIGASSGAVGLRSGPRDSVGTLVDAIAYGGVDAAHPFKEGNAIPAMTSRRSASRLPFDGKDNNNGATDFMIVMTPTPRALNVP